MGHHLEMQAGPSTAPETFKEAFFRRRVWKLLGWSWVALASADLIVNQLVPADVARGWPNFIQLIIAASSHMEWTHWLLAGALIGAAACLDYALFQRRSFHRLAEALAPREPTDQSVQNAPMPPSPSPYSSKNPSYFYKGGGGAFIEGGGVYGNLANSGSYMSVLDALAHIGNVAGTKITRDECINAFLAHARSNAITVWGRLPGRSVHEHLDYTTWEHASIRVDDAFYTVSSVGKEKSPGRPEYTDLRVARGEVYKIWPLRTAAS
jgi:hypothetical protein